MGIKMTLGKRIASGIILMLVLAAVVGGGGYYGLSRVSDVMGLYSDVQTLQGFAAAFKEQSDQYMLAALRADQDAKSKAGEKTIAHLQAGKNTLDQLLANPTLTAEGRARLASAEEAIKSYRDVFDAYTVSEGRRDQMDKDMDGIHETLLARVTEPNLWVEEMTMAVKIAINNVKTYCSRSSPENWKKAEDAAAKFKESMDQWHDKVKGSEELNRFGDQIKAQFDVFKKSMEEYRGEVVAQERLRSGMDRSKVKLYGLCAELGQLSGQYLQAQTRLSNRIIIGVFCVALLIGILYAIFSTRRIVGRIDAAIGGISHGAGEVATYSRQVARASQDLADGASHQAASIEETSSSLEEMSSMVKGNAEHAGEARTMMSEVKGIVEKVSKHMGDMSKAMEAITVSSQETAKIVKTIDEIAFQTNLLALNAAVEAARAGEAGAGFAVVAGEVRNLAMRAAEAARNTAQLIGDTITSVKDGSEIAHATQIAFKENMEISSKVSVLVDEIAGASREQAEGIEQVNKAVADMDRVTQQNASGAEESASAAQEMNAQAGSMKKCVQDLLDLVHGGEIRQEGGGTRMEMEDLALPIQASEAANSLPPARSAGKRFPVRDSREVSPEQIIRLGEENFKDF